MTVALRHATASCNIYRQPAPTAGRAGAVRMHIGGLDCTPLTPTTAEIALRAGLDSPSNRNVSYVFCDVDIRPGDYYEAGGKRNPIIAVGRYQMIRGGVYLELVVENIHAEGQVQ